MSVKFRNIANVCLSSVLVLGFSLWGIFKQDGDMSVSERRPLASLPDFSSETVLNGEFMSEFETYALDQFPLRDSFRTLKAVTAFYVMGKKDNNDIYIADGYASKLEYPLNEKSIDHAAERFRYVYDTYLADSGCNVYLSLIPDKNYFMAEKNGYPSLDYAELVESTREKMDFAQYIDIFPELELSDYYKTDTHWRQEKIIGTAKKLAAAMGADITADFTEKKLDKEFYGVYYGQAALPMKADELYYLESDYLDNCKVFDQETNSYITVYDHEKANGNDAYELFLSGSKSLLTIENPSAENDRELIIFRDSFGSSIAPILADGYAKTTLVDIRYISPNIIGNFVDFEGKDVLFLYSTLVLNNSITIK